MLNRRNLLMLGAAAAALSLAAPASAEDKPFNGVQISVLLEGHPTTDAIQKMVPEFKDKTGIDVAIEVVPEQDITAKELLEFSSKSGRYDVVQNNIIYLPGFVKSGYIVPLDDFLAKHKENFDKSDFVPGYFNTNVLDGKVYGLPVYGESTFVMYRTDLFEQYGLAAPKSFEDIENAAKTISEKTNKQIAGITMRGQQGIQGVYVWAAYLWGFGGSFFDADGKSALATPEGIAALDAFTSVLKNYGPVGVANFGWEENRLLFQQGKAAITLDATVNGAYNEDPAVSTVVGKVGYVPVPMKSTSPKGGSSSLAVHSMYVSAESKNQEAAALFATWATAKEQQLKSIETDPNSGVTSLSALNSDSFGKRYGAFKEGMIAAINAGNPQYLPTVEKANEIINNTGIAVSKALAGTASAADALKEADDANNAALAR
ncbi:MULTISPECIES: sugar ABC transporter substrate-binding protein [unclassified Mesorhizobium]|uniref:ABC transporter substrate-binding protein n=1 Tax=unclassified Mesorhizobium TaxID=325217 RepID=UPI00112DFC57|nr:MULTISPECIES: sugar ABC transporter substrate-binding protein [unclassified Mesorhizobium]MBZ9767027.1 sugar ABC transporter substrate-binding protein [Mesorhizobium sp. CA6]TPI71787.1 sugar ABC transporter substrate-binding protein [Mesorhizobium sp. B2-8-9]